MLQLLILVSYLAMRSFARYSRLKIQFSKPHISGTVRISKKSFTFPSPWASSLSLPTPNFKIKILKFFYIKIIMKIIKLEFFALNHSQLMRGTLPTCFLQEKPGITAIISRFIIFFLLNAVFSLYA